MADPGFPTSHTTTTTTQQTSVAGGGGAGIGFDLNYFKSIPGILRLVQIVIGFLYWVILISYGCVFNGVGWALFVGVSCWVFTVIFYIIFMLGIQRKVTVINWVLTELINNAIWCFLHLIAAIVVSVAAGPRNYCPAGGDGKLDFGAFAGWVLCILYGVSVFFNYLCDFQSMGGMSSMRFGGKFAGWVLCVLYGASLFFNLRDFQSMGGMSSMRFGGASTTTTTTTTQQQSTVVTSNEKGDMDPPPPYPYP